MAAKLMIEIATTRGTARTHKSYRTFAYTFEPFFTNFAAFSRGRFSQRLLPSGLVPRHTDACLLYSSAGTSAEAPAEQGNARGIDCSGFRINLGACVLELCSFLPHSMFKHGGFINRVLRSIFPDILRYLHAAEVRAAHGAEVGGLGAFLRQRLVVELTGGIGV